MFSFRSAFFFAFIVAAAASTFAQNSAARDQSLVLVFKDGHETSFPSSDVSRIEFHPMRIILKNGHEESFSQEEVVRIEMKNSGSEGGVLGRNHFVGKWRVGTGAGGDFFITLDRDGQARKSIGASHGTWTVVDGEARISWDDGWHDAIRKVGDKHEKFAYEPGKSFHDEPSNVTHATNTTAQPI